MPGEPGTLTRHVDLPPAARSVPAARRCSSRSCSRPGPAESFRDDALLLVSELVTNVVRHVSGQVA